MSFFGEIANLLGWDEARLALGYSYINYNGEAVYVEGIKRVLKIDSAEVIFKLAEGLLHVCGKDLAIDELTGGDALVSGEIHSVYDGVKSEAKP